MNRRKKDGQCLVNGKPLSIEFLQVKLFGVLLGQDQLEDRLVSVNV